MRAWTALVALVLAVACFAPTYESGKVACDAQRRCPAPFTCAADNRCWKPGEAPDAGKPAGEDAGKPSTDAGGGGDRPMADDAGADASLPTDGPAVRPDVSADVAPPIDGPVGPNEFINLVPSVGKLSPAFSSSETNYRLDLPLSSEAVTWTITTAHAGGTLRVNDQMVSTGSASATVTVDPGVHPTTFTLQTGEVVRTIEVAVARGGLVTYLKAPVAMLDARFGSALAHDGQLLAVSAPGETFTPADGKAVVREAVHVYARQNGAWTSDGTITSPFGPSAFGSAMDVENGTIVIGIHNRDVSAATHAGGVHVMVKQGGRWTLQTELNASNVGYYDHFGESVALSGDTIAVGAPYEDSAATGANGDQSSNASSESGAVYIFRRTANIWLQEAYLKAPNTGAGDRFGTAVALDGNVLVVGAPREDGAATAVDGDQTSDAAPDAGAAYVFVRSGSTWAPRAYLKGALVAPGSNFGQRVAISGSTIVVAAPEENTGGAGINPGPTTETKTLSGAVHVYQADQTGRWTLQAHIKANNADPRDRFGSALSLDGDELLVGAPDENSSSTRINTGLADNAATDAGAAYLFRRTGAVWKQIAYVKAPNAQLDDRFGIALGLAKGMYVVGAAHEDSGARGVGGSSADESTMDAGAVFAF